MSIQSNINQTLSVAGLLASQTARAAGIKEGKAIQGKQTQAIRGLKDIDENLRREEITNRVGPPTKEEADLIKSKGTKTYNAQELQNIRQRASQYQNDIYNAKSAALNPSYRGLINPNEIKQNELSKTLSSIDDKTNKALERLKARQKEQQSSKIFTRIMNGDIGEDMFGMETNEPNFPEEDLVGMDNGRTLNITDENDPNYVHTLADKRKKAEEELQTLYDNYENLRAQLEDSYDDWHNGRNAPSQEVAENASMREASNILGKLPLNADQLLGIFYEDGESPEDFLKRLDAVISDIQKKNKVSVSKPKNVGKKKPEANDGN